MKRTIRVMVLIAITCIGCITGRNKLTYEFPPEMKPEVRSGYTTQWEKGKALYEVNCAKCHNTRIKNRVVVPDFTQEQLIGYEFRVKNQKHEINLTEETLNAEDMGTIITFLTYKKKNNTGKHNNVVN